MPYQFKIPTIAEFHLEDTDERLGIKDKKEFTKIWVRECTQGDNEQRNALFAEFRREFETRTDPISNEKVETNAIVQNISMDDINKLEVYLTLTDANLLDETPEGEEPKPFFKFKNGRLTSRKDFDVSWAKLPPFIANEIHQKVLEKNPVWSSEGESPLS